MTIHFCTANPCPLCHPVDEIAEASNRTLLSDCDQARIAWLTACLRHLLAAVDDPQLPDREAAIVDARAALGET